MQNPDACEHSLLVYFANLAIYIEHRARQFFVSCIPKLEATYKKEKKKRKPNSSFN